jgi:hypothetical protein
MRFFSWQTLGISLAAALALLAAGGIVYEVKRDDWAKPELRTMREYRVSLMSDDQIRRLNADAVAEVDRLRTMDRETKERAQADRAASIQRCADVVYRERNPADCRRGPLDLFDLSLPIPTAAQIFEENILGVCRFMNTKQDARINKCLPSTK